METVQHITVCICTRNRGPGILVTLRSLLASTYQDFDVLVVDQSTGDETADVVQQISSQDARVSYLRSRTVGLSVARNVALEQARGPLIAFTDDDCQVSESWLAALVGLFQQYPQVGEVCGTVRAVPYDPTAGYIPVYDARQNEQVSTSWRLWRAGGIGANIAFRQEALQVAGPFDPLLGAGAPLHSGEDVDMSYRILKAGYHILNTHDAWVLHDGFRSLSETRLLVRGAYLGIGAMYMKHLRLGDVTLLPALLYFWWGRSLSWKKLLLLRRGAGVGYFLSFSRGLLLSFRYRMNRRQRVYLPRQIPPQAATRSAETEAALPK